MKTRVAALVGPVADRMWVSTFHSACVRILRREAKVLGYPSSFTIYDEADALRLTSYVLRDANVDPKRFPPRGVHNAISAAKNELLMVDDYAEAGPVPLRAPGGRRLPGVPGPPRRRPAPWTSTTCSTEAVRLFEEHPEVLDHYRPVQARPRRRVPGHQPGPERPRGRPRPRAPQHLRRRRQRPVPAAGHAVSTPAALAPSSRWPRATRCSARASGPTGSPAGSPT